MYIVYEVYSFDNFFKLLLKQGYSNEKALGFVLTNCALSGVVFQERIFNKKYLDLRIKNVLSPKEASRKTHLIFNMLNCIKK